MPDPRKKLYSALSSKYDLGSYEEFNSKMNNPESRKKLFTAVSQNFDLGSYNEFENKVKKKEVSQLASQKTQSASKSKPTTTPISSATEETQVPVESDGLDGPPKMKTFTGFTPEEQKTLQAKPAIKVSKSSELIGKRLKLQKELSTIKVTPENQDEVSRKTDELSAVIKAQDEITDSRLSEIENQFKQAKNEDAVKLEADKRLDDLLTTTGVWNNIKSTSLNIYNNLIDQAASITDEPGIKEFKADIDPLSEEKKEVKKDAASRKVKLSDEQVDELAKQLYKDKQIDYIETDNINSFLDDLDESDKNLLKQSRKQTAEHLQESNLKEEKVINAYEVIGNKKIKEYKDLENQILNYKNSGMEVPKELANSYTSLAQEIIGIGSNIQKRQSIINKNKSDLGTAQQEFDLLKRQYGDVENFLLNTGIAARELGVGVISGLDYLGSMANPAAKLSSMQLQSKLADVNKGLEEERSNLRKSVESVESPEGFLNYVSDVMSNQIPNLVVTSTGVGGLATIGLSGTGQKYASMNREVLEGKASYTPLQMASAPLLYGAAEVVSEIPTLSILKKGSRVFESIAKNEGDLIKKTAQQKAKEWAKDWGVDMSKELAGEEFTNFAQNFNDKFVLGKKDVGLLDNTGTVFKDTFTLTSILKAAPHVAGAILKPLQTNKDLNVLDENSRKIIQFSKQLEDESLTDVEKSVIKKQIDKATVENSTILANTIEKVNNMPDDVYKKIIDLNNKAAEIKTDAFDINNGTLPNKKELINDLQQEYKTIQEERNSFIDTKYEPTEEVVTDKPKIDEARKTNLTSDERFSLQQANKFENAKVGDEFSFKEYEDGEFKSYETKVKEIVDGKLVFDNGKTQDDIKSYTNLTAEDAWFAKNKPTTEVISPETSSNYANLTEDKNGDFVFFHVGGKGYDKIKKSTGGTIATSKEEAGALSKVGGVAMYYTSPEDSERMVNGEAKYAVTIPKEKVYDANTDPNNYAEQAKTLHEEENPGKAFDANTKAAYITKIAGENGYDMVVSEWMGKTRAQTTKEFAPTDVELKEGSTIVKPFEEQYTGNIKKGFKSIIPESKEAKLKAVYDEINTEKNRANEYDQLYRLAGQDNSKTPQEDITKLIEEDKTLSQEVKDKYAQALAYKPEQRRTELPVETQFQAHKKNGGSTFLANGENKSGSDASSVSIFTERSKIIDGEITEKDINDFKEANKDLFKGNEDILAIGTWYDAKSGKTYIDVSAVVPNEQAIKLGKQYNQKAVYNLKTNEEVDTGGTGEAIEGLKPEIERVNDIRDILNEKAPKAKPTVAKSKLEAFKAKYINKPVYDRAKLDTQVENAKKSLSKILPDVKFVVHDTKESFIKEAGKNGRGYYDPATKTIHINALEANARTVAHEVFHSVLLDKVKTDANARDLTKRMISSISKTLEGNPELKKNLDDFIKNYDENIQSEEKVAELFGYLAEGYEGFDAPTKSIIKRAMDRLAKIFGLKPFTEGEIVDMLKTLSGKVATGEEIIAKDINVIKEQKTIKDAIKRFQADFIDPKSKIEFVYDKNTEKFKKLEEEGYITKDMSIEDFNGQTIFLHQPDAAFSGEIYKNGEPLVEGKGGVYYPIKFHEDGYFWASTETTANKMAKDLNAARKANGGKLLMALTSAPSDKLLSSTTAANGVMDIILSKAFDRSFSLNKDQVKKSLIDAANKVVEIEGKKVGLGLSFKKGDSLEEVKSEISKKLGPDNSSFADRKAFVKSFISNTADIIKQNPKAVDQFGKFFSEGIKNESFKGVTKTGKLSISAANMTQAISEMLTEPMLKEGIDRNKGGQVYAILELNGDVKAIDSNKHESYPKAIQSVDSNNKVKLHILTDRVQWSDVFEDPKTGNIVTKERQLNIFPTSGVSTQGLVLNTNKGRMQEVNDYNAISKKVLDKNEINSIRASLRASSKDSFALEILDAVSKGEQLGYDSELDATIEEMIQNGVTINNVANILMQDEDFVENKKIKNKRNAIDYLLNIGIKGTVLKAGQKAISEGRLQESESYSDMKDIVQDMIDDGMTITEIKNIITDELGTDQVSLAERAYKELTKVKTDKVIKEQPIKNKQRERSVLKRIKEGGNAEYINEIIDKIGINYTQRNQQQVIADAEAFVDEVGIENAYEAIKNGSIKNGDSVTVIYASIIDRIPNIAENAIEDAKTESEKDAVKSEYNELLETIFEEFSKRQTDIGQATSILNALYIKNQEVMYSLPIQKQKYMAINAGVIDEDTLKKFEALDKRYSDANKKIKELESKLKESIDEQNFKNIIEDFTRVSSKENIGSKARNLAKDIRSGKKTILPSWAVAEAAKGTKTQGLTFEKTFAKALETFADVHDATKDFAKAIEESFKVIKQWYEKNNIDFNEKDIKSKFSEYVNPKTKKLTVTKGVIKIPSEIISNYVINGGSDINELSEQILNDSKDEYPNLTVREIRDKISNYGSKLNKTRSELNNDILRLKSLGRLESQLEDLKKGISKSKNEIKKRALSDLEKKYMVQIKAIKKELGIEDIERTTANENYVRRKIEELKEKIKNNDFSKKEVTPIKESEELKKLKTEKNRVQEEYDKIIYTKELENRTVPEKITGFLSDMWDAQRVTRATGELSFVGAQGGFYMINSTFSRKTFNSLVKNFKGTKLSDWVKSPIKTISNIIKSATSAETIIEMFNKMGNKNNYDDYQSLLKAHPYYDVFLKSKLRILSEDIKTQVRDEMFIGNHFLHILKLPFTALTKFEKGKKRITLQGYYEKLKTGKVSEKNIKTAEEIFEAVNPLGAFERGNNTFMNMARVEMFMDGVQALEMQGKNPVDHLQDYKDLASAVNTITGTGNLNKQLSMALPMLNKLFFSPRFWAASLNMTPPVSLYYLAKLGNYDNVTLSNPKTWGSIRPTVAQKAFVKPMIKGLIAFYGMSALVVSLINSALDDDDEMTEEEKNKKRAYIEYDPRSSNFMQVISGDTKTDFFGPYRNNIVLFSRLFTGQTSKDGNIIENGAKWGSRTDFQIASEYIAGKANPFPGMFVRYSMGKKEEVLNEETNLKENRRMLFDERVGIDYQTKENLMPIFVGTVKDIVDEDPVLGSAFYTTLALFGKQTSVYKKKSSSKGEMSDENLEKLKTNNPEAYKKIKALREKASN